MEKSKKRSIKKMEFPHTLVIIMAIIVIVALLSYIIPAGVYDKVKSADGRMVVDPSSYHLVEQNPTSIFAIFRSVIAGMKEVAPIANTVLIIGGSFAIVEATGSTKAILGRVLKSNRSNGVWLLPIVIVCFSLIVALTSSAETMLAFIPLGILFARMLGYDAMVGLSITVVAGSAGFASGLINVFTTGVAQSLLGVTVFSGLWFRAVGYVLLLCSVCFWTVWYATRIKKDPTKSICYDVELRDKGKELDTEIDTSLGIRRILVLIEFAAVLAIIVIASLNKGKGIFEKWDFFIDTATVIFILGIASGITMGYSMNKIVGIFIGGTKQVLVGALVVGFARGISITLANAQIIDSVVYGFSNLIGDAPKVIGGLFIYLFQLILNVFIISGSGQAAATIPIVGPLGDVLGLHPQTIVTAFIYGDGITNVLLPMSAVTMGGVALAGISYPQYVKYLWRIIATNIVLGGVMVVISTFIFV